MPFWDRLLDPGQQACTREKEPAKAIAKQAMSILQGTSILSTWVGRWSSCMSLLGEIKGVSAASRHDSVLLQTLIFFEPPLVFYLHFHSSPSQAQLR